MIKHLSRITYVLLRVVVIAFLLYNPLKLMDSLYMTMKDALTSTKDQSCLKYVYGRNIAKHKIDCPIPLA